MAVDKFITANGLKLHYLDFGGAGPWLVCIHGLTANAHSFDVVAPRLASKYHVISVDVRGRGDSEWGPPTEYLPQNYVSDLAAMLDQLGASRVTLVGTSMGGIISIIYAGGYTDRVERLVLNDIGPEIAPAGLARIAAYVGEAPDRFKDLAEVAAYFRTIYLASARMTDDALIEMVKWSVKPAPGGGLTWKMDPAVRRPMRGGTAQQRFDLWVPFARILCPVLIVRGADSDILAPDTVTRMQAASIGAKVVEVPGVGHAPTLGEPAAIAALSEFLGL
jgi:pimeloyl-ACP methyl ester carboxylesterase